MKSAAETGYCFNVRRLRLQEKLVLLKYDPIDDCTVAVHFMTFHQEVNVTLILQTVAVKQSNHLPDTSESLMTAMPHVSGKAK
ncbi:hypothetical protein Q9966_009691 [Columba livia]|nr:hypothetical protein Q9966_009691 [Columba livia]